MHLTTNYQPDLSLYPEASLYEMQKQSVISDLSDVCREALTELMTISATGNIERLEHAKKNLDVIYIALELTDDLHARVTARKLAGII